MSLIVRDVLERYIAEMPTIGRQIGASHLYTLRRLQRSMLAEKSAAKLTKAHIIDFCKARHSEGATAPTINQDISLLRGPLKFAGAAWDDCADVSDAPIIEAMPLLKKYQLIGKSRPRDRRPTSDEIERLLAYFDAQEKKARTEIPMRAIVEFSLLTARRISETCRLRWGDVNAEDRTCIVRDMKDPKSKRGNDHEFPLIGRAWDLVMEQPRRTHRPDERIFPYRAMSCSTAYMRAKAALGIEGLHLHDNRREAASRFIEGHASFGGEKHSIPETMVLTGHKNPTILLRTYTRLRAKDLHPKQQAVSETKS